MRMQKRLSLLIGIAFPVFVHAQDFAGFRSGNYTGVNGVFYNPANIADNRYRWDVNLPSVNSSIGNNRASFNLGDDVFHNTFSFDSLKNKVFGKEAGLSSGQAIVNITGPSVMFSIGPKLSFALTSRVRSMITVQDMDGKLIDKLSNDFENDPELPYNIQSNADMRLTANAWTEFGISAGRVIMNKGPHFLKAGVSLKYLAGAANAYTSLYKFNSRLNEDLVQQDVYLSNTTGSIAMGFGGIRLDDVEVEDLTAFESSGFGADLGVVYEFRPPGAANNGNKYLLKAGLAVLDIGSIKYTRDPQRSGGYTFDITGSERFYLSELEGGDIDDYKTVFDSRPNLFIPTGNNGSSYKVSLPTMLQADVDYHVIKGLYVNAAGQFSLVNKAKAWNSRIYNTITVTPRYETRWFGAYLPVSHNELVNWNAGLSLRFGPVFLGSGSVFTALLDKSKQADVFFGVRFGGFRK
jgi:hypothetical protein